MKEYNERHKKWYGKLLFWERAPTPAPPNTGSGAFTPTTRPSSARGAGSRCGTPPAPGIVMKQRDRSRSPMPRGDSTARDRGGKRDRDSAVVGVADMRTVVLGKTMV